MKLIFDLLFTIIIITIGCFLIIEILKNAKLNHKNDKQSLKELIDAEIEWLGKVRKYDMVIIIILFILTIILSCIVICQILCKGNSELKDIIAIVANTTILSFVLNRYHNIEMKILDLMIEYKRKNGD